MNIFKTLLILPVILFVSCSGMCEEPANSGLDKMHKHSTGK